MGKVERGRLTISANIILTASLITRTLSFGYVILSIYIKAGGDILDTNVIKMLDIMKVIGDKPFGSTVQSIVFSLIPVFVLEFVTGIFGLVGALTKRRMFLVMAVLMSSLMIMVYTVYIVLISLIYHKTDNISSTLLQYAHAYNDNSQSYISWSYRYYVFPSFLSELGCGFSYSEYTTCSSAYKEQVRTYLQTYFGITITCFLCHVVSIIAVEYTYRKFELKENNTQLSSNKYYLLTTIRHGIGRSFICCIRDGWKKSKVIFFSVLLRTVSLIVSLGLLVLGLTLCGDEFINHGSLRHIFYQLRFYQYTFYDILIGLAASSVVLGILGSAASVISLLGSWKKSKMLVILATLSSTFLILPKILIFVIWAVFISELRLQQNGYYYYYYTYQITAPWNNMIMSLDCCGVDSQYDTFSDPNYGQWFCCKNSHESRMDAGSQYSNSVSTYLDYFGGCGGYRSDTCSDKILFKTRMFTGWFLAILLLSIIIEIVCILFVNKEYFISHHKADVENDATSRTCFRICHRTFNIYDVSVSKIKSFFKRHYKRSKLNIVFIINVGIIMVLSVCTLSIGVHIRYDTVFGNGDIKELLKMISITETNFNTAIENFSIIVSTFSLMAIGTGIYSISILIPHNNKKVLTLVGLGLWIAMFLFHIIAIGLWAKFITEINSSVTYHLTLDLNNYRYSHQSEHYTYYDLSFYWNTLFVKGKCCGVSDGGSVISSFEGTQWYNSYRDSNSQYIPVQCCISQTEIYPYESKYDTSCTNTPQLYHDQGCNTVIEERLIKNYSIPFLVLTSIILLAEIACIVTIIISLIKKDHCVNSSDETDNSEVDKEDNRREIQSDDKDLTSTSNGKNDGNDKESTGKNDCNDKISSGENDGNDKEGTGKNDGNDKISSGENDGNDKIGSNRTDKNDSMNIGEKSNNRELDETQGDFQTSETLTKNSDNPTTETMTENNTHNQTTGTMTENKTHNQTTETMTENNTQNPTNETTTENNTHNPTTETMTENNTFNPTTETMTENITFNPTTETMTDQN